MPQKRPHGCLVGTEEAPCLRLGEQTPTPQATPKLRVRPKQQDAGSLWCRGKTERRGRKEMPMGPRNGDRKSCSSLNLSCSGRKQRYLCGRTHELTRRRELAYHQNQPDFGG